MKTAILFYSWSGHVKSIAEARATEEGTAIYQVKDQKRPGTLQAYTAGCFRAMRMKKTAIEMPAVPFDELDHIVIIAPVWAGYLAPAAISAIDALPSGKNVTVCAVSASGKSRCREKVGELVRAKGCKFIGFEDRKGSVVR